MADQPDHYKVLQVDSEADPDVIQAAYRRLAQKFHPDVAADSEAAAKMTAINRAWEVLRDPAQRTAYDRARRDALSRTSRAGLSEARSQAYRPTDWAASPGAAATGRPAPDGHDQASRARPEEVSRDWTTGRSSIGGGYDPASMRTADSVGSAGRAPGNASGSVLNFGRYAGWSLGEIGRHDLEYIEWLDRMPIGRPYRDEIDGILRRSGRRQSASAEAAGRRGLFRRR